MLLYYDGPEEWFPVHALTADNNSNYKQHGAREFTAEEIADIKRVMREFQGWQDKIADRFGLRRHEYMPVIED